MRPTIGVLGGLGPWATLYFFEQVLRLTPAGQDQDHLRLIIDNNPLIPDRSAALFGRGEDPTPALVATARNVEAAGADLLAIPCNTAHAFFEPIAAAVRIPVLHIMRETAAALRRHHPRIGLVGLLATSATVTTGLYQQACEPVGIRLLAPTAVEQPDVDRLIFAIKAQRVDEGLRERVVGAGRRLVERGAEAVVLGCTELPLAMREDDLGVPVLDSTTILAGAAVRAALEGDRRRAAPEAAHARST